MRADVPLAAQVGEGTTWHLRDVVAGDLRLEQDFFDLRHVHVTAGAEPRVHGHDVGRDGLSRHYLQIRFGWLPAVGVHSTQ